MRKYCWSYYTNEDKQMNMYHHIKKQSINIHCVNHLVESGDQAKVFVQEP